MTIDPISHKQLFLDDHAVESMEGVKRVLHQPEKQGPVLRADVQGGQNAVQSRNAPQWNSEKGVWEWFYWSYYEVPPHGPRAREQMRVDCYATSTDLVHWERPSLGLYEWNRSKDNNICHDPEGRSLYHIYRDENEPDPGRRYKGMFGFTERWLGVSPDGFDWTMLDLPAIPSHDESHFFFDEIDRRYTLMHKLPTEWGRSVWLSRSADWAHWSEPVLVMHTDEIDRENRRKRIEAVVADPRYLAPPLIDGVDYNAETYHMAVMPYEGIYIGFPLIFNPAGAVPPPHGNFTALNQVELTVSRDLHQWDRVADRALFLGIEPWDGVNFDTAQILLTGRPIVRDDDIWVFHVAYRYRGPRELYLKAGHDYTFEIGAMNLAKLRLDGFVSLDSDGSGSILTKPFAVTAGNLRINADASRGEVKAKLIDAETEKPLAGQSGSITGDHLDVVVIGNIMVGRPVRVRFTLNDASLYSFWMESL